MRYRFQYEGQIYEISIEREGSAASSVYRAVVDGQSYDLEMLDSQPGQLSLRFADRQIILYWAAGGGSQWTSLNGCTYRLEKPAARAARGAGEIGAGEVVRAPMPAQVRAVQAQEGDVVVKGQVLLLLEAMKMEIRIKAPTAGRVTKLLVSSGQTVEKDQPLAEVLAERGE